MPACMPLTVGGPSANGPGSEVLFQTGVCAELAAVTTLNESASRIGAPCAGAGSGAGWGGAGEGGADGDKVDEHVMSAGRLAGSWRTIARKTQQVSATIVKLTACN